MVGEWLCRLGWHRFWRNLNTEAMSRRRWAVVVGPFGHCTRCRCVMREF